MHLNSMTVCCNVEEQSPWQDNLWSVRELDHPVVPVGPGSQQNWLGSKGSLAAGLRGEPCNKYISLGRLSLPFSILKLLKTDHLNNFNLEINKTLNTINSIFFLFSFHISLNAVFYRRMKKFHGRANT